MDLPINHKDLDTIVQSLALGGDARLYHLLKDIRDDNRREGIQKVDFSKDPNVKVFSESDDYHCKQGACDI